MKTIDDCIAAYPQDVQVLLQDIRKTIQNAAPEAVETISYGIPTFKLKGKNLVHFSATKKHIGFYPTPDAIDRFKKELTDYNLSKGTIQFPLDKPLPTSLIIRIVKFRVKQVNG